jgi:hypothetical protein
MFIKMSYTQESYLDSIVEIAFEQFKLIQKMDAIRNAKINGEPIKSAHFGFIDQQFKIPGGPSQKAKVTPEVLNTVIDAEVSNHEFTFELFDLL